MWKMLSYMKNASIFSSMKYKKLYFYVYHTPIFSWEIWKIYMFIYETCTYSHIWSIKNLIFLQNIHPKLHIWNIKNSVFIYEICTHVFIHDIKFYFHPWNMYWWFIHEIQKILFSNVKYAPMFSHMKYGKFHFHPWYIHPCFRT